MKVIFTDLDGTLLDHDTYSFQSAQNALQIINNQDIPLSICTSKTKAEIEYWRKQLNNHHPFIAENGGGIYVPKKYFPFNILHDESNQQYYIIHMDKKKGLVHQVIHELKKQYRIKSFVDMTAEEIAEDADLPINQARLAKKRDHSIPFKILDKDQTDNIISEIEKHHLHYTKGGRYFHLTGDIDKGEAARTLLYLYKKKFGTKITSIGIGDSENDFPLLDTVDKPYLVKKKDGTYASNDYLHAEGIGPAGWQQIIQKELKI